MIIESGLDIPSVNTLIVDRADTLGLAQLYQLRGRVGRSSNRAFAYLLVPSRRVLTEDAEKRLRVIEEFDELGVGFKIALKDLEIRGAGNMLGPEQSGFIIGLGFDLYVKLLEEAVAELKGDAQRGAARAAAAHRLERLPAGRLRAGRAREARSLPPPRRVPRPRPSSTI